MRSAHAKIYVLGTLNNFRNQSEIDKSPIKSLITKIEGYTAESRIIDSVDLNAKDFFFWYNRPITRSEAACALGHRKIVEKAFKESRDLTIVLEDDARIPSKFDISRYSRILCTKKPTLLLIAGRIDATLTIRRLFCSFNSTFRKCISMPTHTQAYALNRQAVEEISRIQKFRDLDSLADFPPWYFDVLNIIMLTPPDAIAESNSLIGQSGRIANRRNVFMKIYRFSCLGWFLEYRKFCKLSSYIKFIHGRALASIKMHFSNWIHNK